MPTNKSNIAHPPAKNTTLLASQLLAGAMCFKQSSPNRSIPLWATVCVHEMTPCHFYALAGYGYSIPRKGNYRNNYVACMENGCPSSRSIRISRVAQRTSGVRKRFFRPIAHMCIEAIEVNGYSLFKSDRLVHTAHRE